MEEETNFLVLFEKRSEIMFKKINFSTKSKGQL